MLYDLTEIDGWEDLSPVFCNKPVNASSTWDKDDEAVAIIFLCGHLAEHDGECDPLPPVEDLI